MTLWVIAVSQKEANELVAYGFNTEEAAKNHLSLCKEPPTDPFYAEKLHVYKVTNRKESDANSSS